MIWCEISPQPLKFSELHGSDGRNFAFGFRFPYPAACLQGFKDGAG
jgi:hypothetical protein